MVELYANSGDPDQTPRSAASDLGLHCLPVTRLWVSSLLRVKYTGVGPTNSKLCIFERLSLWPEGVHTCARLYEGPAKRFVTGFGLLQCYVLSNIFFITNLQSICAKC